MIFFFTFKVNKLLEDETSMLKVLSPTCVQKHFGAQAQGND
jgi:hypothetical protein